MERKLHPLFQQAPQGNPSNIQMQFDPTPVQLKNATQEKIRQDSDIQEFIQEIKLKINRMSQRLNHFEERLDHVISEVRTNHSHISGRLNEKGLHDTKIESMIERHNQLVNAFEKRLSQMAKVIEDSQSQLMATQGALEDARREIARLKRI